MAVTSFKAGEAISAGDVVYLSSAGFLYKSSSVYKDQASSIGVALDSGAANSLIRVNSDFLYTAASGLTPGEYRYVSLAASGTTETYNDWFSVLGTTSLEGAYLSILGRAVSASGIEVERSKPIFISNPTSVITLESSAGFFLDAMLQEDGSMIDLEVA